ncbi:MAG TPA: pyrroloquinoline quinone-dependent dehydrogenase [Myxococcota bacterium]|nr:pyrroloquinoline quinone-dependent dehydrogenase [Myxococcota bacterium]
MNRHVAIPLVTALALAAGASARASDATRSDWPVYGGDDGGSRWSPLDQIRRENVQQLTVAWKVRTGDFDAVPPPPAHSTFEATPILVDGLLVLPTPLGRVLALDPETGAERWRFDATVAAGHYPEYTSRGVASWLDETAPDAAPCRRRIFAATVESKLYAIDAATGRRCESFGERGEVDLRKGVGELHAWDYTISSPPTVIGGLVIVGSAIGDNQRVDAPRGVVRAYDVRSGALRWSWDPVPRDAADPAFAAWKPEQARRVGAANAWSILSVDRARDLVFVPTGSASPDYYGGERLGRDDYADSVVALRASTGQVVWHFQVVHHDLWDYDVPAQPVLSQVTRGGAEVPAVVQATKMGHLFVLQRETGEPLFPVEERPVPASDVPGEQSWPTQPFPVLPEPIVPQQLRAEDAFGLTRWDRGRCRERIAALRNEGLFTPPSLRGTLELPGIAGGTNWGSAAVDPRSHVAFLNATNLAFSARLIPRADFDREKAAGGAMREYAPQAGTPFGMVRGPILSPLFLPCTPPPWGVVGAVSLDTGRWLWKVRFGTIPDRIPLRFDPGWGLPNLGGPLATAGGLVFLGASMDGYLRAFDAETGAELWRDALPAGGQANPMTYRGPSGRQFVVIAAGGHGKLGTRRGDWVVAYALSGAN